MRTARTQAFILAATSATVCAACPTFISAQQHQQPQSRIHVNSDLVALSVTLRDPAGNLVAGLHREQFQLFDDDVEQKIAVFAQETVPLSLVILVDNDLNGKTGLDMLHSVRAALAALSLQDRATICRFDMLFYPGENFTSDLDTLVAEMHSAQTEIKPTPKYVPDPVICGNSTTGAPCIAAPTYAGSRPSKALDDALFSASELLRSAAADTRKIILLISDGVNEPKLNKHNFESVKERLLDDNISVFSLATGSKSREIKILPHGRILAPLRRRHLFRLQHPRHGTTLFPHH